MLVTLDAREESLLYVWSHASILPILLHNGKASWELSRLMAERMQRASELVEGLAFHPVAGRLARLLLDHFAQSGDSAISRNLALNEWRRVLAPPAKWSAAPCIIFLTRN